MTCPNCKGEGYLQGPMMSEATECIVCKGKGDIVTPEEIKERQLRLRDLAKENNKMSEFAQSAIKEGLVSSMSEGRRIYSQLK